MIEPARLAAELVARLGEPDDRLPPEVLQSVRSVIAEARCRFQTIERRVTFLSWEGERGGLLYDVVGRTEEGREIRWTGSAIGRIRDGRCLELVVNEDRAAWQLQLGLEPQLPSDAIDGTWYGRFFGLPFYLQLRTTPCGVRGVIDTSLERLPVTGAYRFPEVAIDSHSREFSFRGEWVVSNRIEGQILPLPDRMTLVRLPAWTESALAEGFDARVLWDHLTS